MDIKKYLEYANSAEARAVLFVKKHLKQADNTVWVDILDCYAPAGYETEKLMFKYVSCELFPRKTTPRYPHRSQFKDEYDYITECRAITWETARKDINMLSLRGYIGRKYKISGVSYPKYPNLKPGRTMIKPDPDKFFVESAPPEIKALAKNLNDRTDPLWEKAMQYISPLYGGPPMPRILPDGTEDDGSGYIFKITGIRRI